MRIFRILVLVFYPFLARADLDQAVDAYNEDNFERVSILASQVLAGELSSHDRLLGREILAISQYFLGEVGRPLLQELLSIDQVTVQTYGRDSIERLSVLFVLSNLQFDLGELEKATHTDVQIVRIALQHPDATNDLLWALRNLAITHENAPGPRTAVQYSALFEFHAIDQFGLDNPLAQEATAMSALALLNAGDPARATMKFVSYSTESWNAFADIGPDEAALVADVTNAIDALPIVDHDAWYADIQLEIDEHQTREALITEITQMLEAGGFDFGTANYERVLEKMRSYLNVAYPEDPVSAFYTNMILRYHLGIGDFVSARPYLAGVLDYPSPYAAALNMPIGTMAGVLAMRGAVEDVLFEPLVIKALEIEAIVASDDPEIAFELSFALAQVKARNGDPEAALSAYKQALELAQQGGRKQFRQFNQALHGAGLSLSQLGRNQEAKAIHERMLVNARADNDGGAMSAALGALSITSASLGELGIALSYAREKLALEDSQDPPDVDAIHTAKMNLALTIMKQTDDVTPELAQLLPDILAGASKDSTLGVAQSQMMVLVAERLAATPDTIRGHPIFVTVSNAERAQLVAFMGEAAADQSEFQVAKSWIKLGYELAVVPSDEYFRLKQVEGRIAWAEDRPKDALMAFRAISDHRIQPAIREEAGALEHLPFHMAAAYKFANGPQAGNDLRFQNEMFLLAQLASETSAGSALNTVMARDQADDATRHLLRERERLSRDLIALEGAIAQSRYDGKSPDSILKREMLLRQQHSDLNDAIAQSNPGLGSMTAFNPLGLTEVADRLRDDEVLVVFVTSDLSLPGDEPASFLIAVTRDDVQVTGLPGRSDLASLSRALRCSAALTDPNCSNGGDIGTRGAFAMLPGAGQTGPVFDTTLAHQAYLTLVEPMAEILNGKSRLIIVPDHVLVSLPFHLLLRAPLPPTTSLNQGQWLVRDHSIEIAPTVAAFIAMRDATSQRNKNGTFLGVGDPLIGEQRKGPMHFECSDRNVDLILTASVAPNTLKRSSGQMRSQLVADLTALPDSRCELQEIADHFRESTLLLHDKATEADLKAMSDAGTLKQFSVLSFATHGLIAGEIGVNDSGLVLTPPAVATAKDDGLLTTSEIADLEISAEFVILSACNTASGDARNEEGLSGMASAFFLAGARSLMVSHWPVYSDAAVDLTTRTFAILGQRPDTPRAEAVRLAMLSVLDDPHATPRKLHPAYWGPFMIVGDGLGLSPDQ